MARLVLAFGEEGLLSYTLPPDESPALRRAMFLAFAEYIFPSSACAAGQGDRPFVISAAAMTDPALKTDLLL